ncbi:MAG: hypothetical protein ABW128_16845 [Rhizorhabdus sp.]
MRDKMNTLQLLSGNVLDYDDPMSIVFDEDDILIPLANNCRWAGQLQLGRWYSILQHSWNTAQIVRPEFKREAAWHDRSESFTNDIVTPLKRMFPGVKALEVQLEIATARRLGLPETMSPEVHLADMQMLAIEITYLKGGDVRDYRSLDGIEFDHLTPLVDLTSWTPRLAYHNFKLLLEDLDAQATQG